MSLVGEVVKNLELSSVLISNEFMVDFRFLFGFCRLCVAQMRLVGLVLQILIIVIFTYEFAINQFL